MKIKSPGYRACNVLLHGRSGRQIWQFSVGKEKFTKTSEVLVPAEAPLPVRTVGRDWRQFVQPKLNIACLPPELIFVRAIQMPVGAPEEIPGMVEFELEKLSPLPPAQIVWTAEVLQRSESGLSTILVAIAARSAVEEFLGNLEAAGFIADRLELPLVRELSSIQSVEDGVWILADQTNALRTALVGWRMGGLWREVALLRLAEGGAGAVQLTQQLDCGAWAGELAGWLEKVPQVHLFATPELVHEMEPILQEWCGEPVTVHPRTAPDLLAQAGARHHLQPAGTSLVPPELLARHRSELIYGLWVKGLGTAGMTYLVLLFCYFGALKYREYQLDDLRGEAIALGKSYTNTLQLKERVAVIQGQIDLRFAALNAWRAAVEHLPESLTLSKLNFDKGRTLKLIGTVPPENRDDVTRYNSDLQKVVVDGQPLFARVNPAQTVLQGGAYTWSFDAELRRSENP